MSESFDLGAVQVVTVGTVGPPGQRIFYFQAAGHLELLTLKMEKQQVAALVEHLAKVLADLPPVTEPVTAPDLIEPIEQRWIVGAMAVTPYDDASDSISMVIEEAVPADEEETGAKATLTLTKAQLAALVVRAQELLEAGRPPCPLCGGPLDPEGHVCPRSNGHRTR